MKKKFFTLTLTLILLFVFATPALAQGPDGAKVVFGENLTLEGETLNRDLVVFGGNVSIDSESTVRGDMIVFGGSVTIEGQVDGDMGVIGGNVTVADSAVIDGDVGLLGGHADIAEGAEVRGEVQSLTRLDYDYDHGRLDRGDDDDDIDRAFPEPPPAPRAPASSDRWSDFFGWIFHIVSEIVWTIGLLVVLGLLSWLVAAFMPEQMMQVRRTVQESTPVSFGVGLVTSLVAAVVGFLLLLTICLAFIPILAYILLGIAGLFGWIVIGQILGERLLLATDRDPGLISSSVIGVSVLTLLTNMPVIGEIPCLGWLLSLVGAVVGLLVMFTGMGAVLLTRFGNRPYPADSPTPYSGGFGGGSRSSGGDFSGGPRVRWTDPAPDVSEEDAPTSETELKAKIKAALAEADQPSPAEPDAPADAPADDQPEPPADDEDKPKPKPPPGD